MKISPEDLNHLRASGAAVLRTEKKAVKEVPTKKPEPKRASVEDLLQQNTDLLRSVLNAIENQPAPVVNVSAPAVAAPERKPIRVRATVTEHNSKGRIKTVEFIEL